MGTFFGAVIFACGLWFGLSDADAALWAGFMGLVGFYVLGMAFVVSSFLFNLHMCHFEYEIIIV